jgi:hypothetical protein
VAYPASFPESNEYLSRPAGLENAVDPLSVACVSVGEGVEAIISCWKFSQEELDEVNRTGRVWLGVLGLDHPPVFVAGIKPFESEIDCE